MVYSADLNPNREGHERRKLIDLEVSIIRKLISCSYNEDSQIVELCYSDGTLINIDCIAIEDTVARNMYERSELDYLLYHDPLSYAALVLKGDIEAYLRNVTDYRPLDERE